MLSSFSFVNGIYQSLPLIWESSRETQAEQTASDHSTPVSFSQWQQPGQAELSRVAALLPSSHDAPDQSLPQLLGPETTGRREPKGPAHLERLSTGVSCKSWLNQDTFIPTYLRGDPRSEEVDQLTTDFNIGLCSWGRWSCITQCFRYHLLSSSSGRPLF